jgi:Flp pilus assembly protein TadD
MNHFFRRLLTVCLVIAVAVIGGMHARRVFKRAKAKGLVAEAARHLNSKDYKEASRCLHAALRANSSSIEATKLTADLLDAVGSPVAISWRIRASQLRPGDMTNRLDWAQTALKLGDFKSAEDALSGLDEAAKSTARHHKLAGAVAWSKGNAQEAEEHYQQARQLEPGDPSNILNLGTIGLVSTNEEVAAAARLKLQVLAENNPAYALEAFRHLAREAVNRRNLAEALAYTQRVATNEAATFNDKTDYLNLLTATKDANARSWLMKLKQQATNSVEETLAMGRWIFRTDGPTNALAWLMSLPQSLQTNLPVPLVITDAQIMTKDWTRLLATVENKDWGESEVLRLATESLARRSLGQEDDAQILWKRARRQSARRLDRLYKLTQLTDSWGWEPEKREVLMQILTEFPHEKWAVDMLILQLHKEGATQELEQLVSKVSENDPTNMKFKSSLARLYLLRRSQLDTAYHLAKEAFEGDHNDPIVLSTYAYSLLVQGKKDEALRALDGLKPGALQIPWVATCYGVIEAQSGNKQAAREPLERAKSAKLLPEEMELVLHAAAN